jgi:hypothetical protein
MIALDLARVTVVGFTALGAAVTLNMALTKSDEPVTARTHAVTVAASAHRRIPCHDLASVVPLDVLLTECPRRPSSAYLHRRSDSRQTQGEVGEDIG